MIRSIEATTAIERHRRALARVGEDPLVGAVGADTADLVDRWLAPGLEA
jgi:hypothetical protein